MAQLDKIRLSGTTYDIIDATAVHSLDGYYTTGETNNAITAATNALAESIAEMNYATTGYVQSAIAEASGVTTGTVQSMIDSSISGKADYSTVVTNIEFTKKNGENKLLYSLRKDDSWSAGAEVFTAGSGLTMNNKTVSIDFTKVAVPSDIPSVTGYADAVAYDTNSKEMKFYNGGTGGTEVFSFDASPFIIDGMVENVEIKDVAGSGTCLVVSFNTDAGKQDINIPISQIFDASNYYTTAQTDTKISEATSGKVDTSTYTAYTAATDTALGNKADTTAMTQAINEATSGKADTTAVTAINTALTAHTSDSTIHVTSSDKTTWSGKQDALVSGENIKTINSTSILGSGDITTLQVEVSGTTLVFS